jgi:cell division protein FtsI (penicillin-binding protein 3)
MSFSSRNSSSPTKPRFAQRSRFFIVKTGVLFAFSLLAIRLVYVQAVLRDELEVRADRQTNGFQDASSTRFRIYDRNGVALAETVNVASCFADPTRIKDKRGVSLRLGSLLGMDPKRIENKIRKARGSFVWISRNVPAPTVAAIRNEKIAGIGFQTEKRRHYPIGPVASHVLGLVGHENTGLCGVEQLFDKNLKPSTAADNVRRGDVYLTIDSMIQQVAERELEWGVKKTGAKRGLVLAQDPHTGEVLALASWPPLSLDPDLPSPPTEMRIPGLVDVFEPGSTFKVVIAASALEEKAVSAGERFSGEKGAWKVKDITIHDHEPLQQMSFEDIIIHSSNIGTAKLAERIGAERLYQYARLFGFGVFPGSGFGHEAKGVLRPLAKWSGVSKYVVSFGQEIGVTAIQLVDSYSALANGGILMEPRLVKKIVNKDGEDIWHPTAMAVRRVVSQETATALTKVLVNVVEKGTGINAQISWDPDTKVAGKTGTAQKWDAVRHRYHEVLTLVSFCGYFPADNPRLTMLVLLDEPEGRRWGGLDAAPVFRRIAEQISTHLKDQPLSTPASVM